MFKIIVAINNKGVIGLNEVMPWHVSEDLKHFKETTLHHNIVMGRVTHENLPGELPDRTTWIVSRTQKDPFVINDFQGFLKKHQNSSKLYFIAGGENIYNQAIDYSSEIILSRIDNDLEGDTYFPTEKLEDFTLMKTIHKENFNIEYYNRKER